jgi:hypothetical protein
MLKILKIINVTTMIVSKDVVTKITMTITMIITKAMPIRMGFSIFPSSQPNGASGRSSGHLSACSSLRQVIIVYYSGSIALLADTIHKSGDAITVFPLRFASKLAWCP